jgi:inositol phosphorylceramide mannosyltransferase catalytic subunit
LPGQKLIFIQPCTQSLEPLRYYPAFTTGAGQGTLSNNIMGGQPDHPWFHLLTQNLVEWNWNLLLPYVIISYTSGQWYVTAMWDMYHQRLSADGTVRGMESAGATFGSLHHIMMDERPGADEWVFFGQTPGVSWQTWDIPIVGWILNHYILDLFVLSVWIGYRIWRSCCTPWVGSAFAAVEK